MLDRQQHALLALRIAEGVAQDQPAAEDLIAAAFDGPQEAAEAYAHLSGFLLQTLASVRFGGSVPAAAAAARSLIDRSR